MVFDSRRLGMGGVGPAGSPSLPPVVPAAPAATEASPLDQLVLPDAPTVRGDASHVGVDTGVQGPAGPGGKKTLDFSAAFSADVQKVLPGARLTGDWSVEQVHTLKATLQDIPAAMAQRVHGTEFVLMEAALAEDRDNQRRSDRAKQADMAAIVQALRVSQNKTINISKEAFALPSVKGVPGFKRLMLQELAMLMNEKAGKLADFAKLSGWKQSRVDARGSLIERPREATGFATGEQTSGSTGPLAAEAARTAAPAASGPLASRLGTRPLPNLKQPEAPRPRPGSGPMPGRTGPLRPGGSAPLASNVRPVVTPGAKTGPLAPAAALTPVGNETIEGGSRVAYSDKTSVAYTHGADARFLTSSLTPGDPREDFAEAFQAYMLDPKGLMARAPEKFLYLNAEGKRFGPAETLAMAKEAGVDPTQVVTSLLVSGRANQAAIDRICEFHGIAADKVALLGKDQELLGRGASLEALVERLTLDIGVNGSATTRLLALGEELRAKHLALTARLPLTRTGKRLGARNGVVSWLLGQASDRLLGSSLERLDAELADTRAQFTKLPLAVQLRADPRLALGASWFSFSSRERALLGNPTALQQLIAKAGERADDVAYIPQRLTPNEKSLLAYRTLIDSLFDPSSQGVQLRAKLAGVGGGTPQAEGALSDLRARNGDAVWGLLTDEQRKTLSQPSTQLALRKLLEDPEMQAALDVLRDGTTGAMQLKARLLRFLASEVKPNQDPVKQLAQLQAALKETRLQLLKDLGRSPLEIALTQVNRQVQEGNMRFIQRFLGANGPEGLAKALGPWVTQALSPAERKLLDDGDYRRHLVTNAEQIRSTGVSLLEEAHQYRVQTRSLQAALSALLEPDEQFRLDFAKDPVAALKSRGLWLALPDKLQTELAEGSRKASFAKLSQAISEILTPALARPLGRQKRLENLQKAVAGVNAGNFFSLLGLLDMSAQDLAREVKSGLMDALAGEAEHEPGGPLSFV